MHIEEDEATAQAEPILQAVDCRKRASSGVQAQSSGVVEVKGGKARERSRSGVLLELLPWLIRDLSYTKTNSQCQLSDRSTKGQRTSTDGEGESGSSDVGTSRSFARRHAGDARRIVSLLSASLQYERASSKVDLREGGGANAQDPSLASTLVSTSSLPPLTLARWTETRS